MKIIEESSSHKQFLVLTRLGQRQLSYGVSKKVLPINWYTRYVVQFTNKH